jgi:acetyltransferase-like isoleucine patch superfamily enzyme
VNINLILKKLLRRPTLKLGSNSSIGSSARILNASDKSDRIKVGKNTRIEGELFIFPHGGQLEVGDWCFIGPGSRIWSACNIFIGDRVLISHNCNIIDSLTHPINANKRHLQFKDILTSGHPKHIDLGEQPVKINDDVWIGAGSTILRGVSIGCASIVGAGSVVTSDVPPYTIVAGNPARIIRTLNAEELAP